MTRRNDVGVFWVVEYPRPASTLPDIVFTSDVAGMMLQALGGLRPEEIAGIFHDKEEAIAEAQRLLGLRDALNHGVRP